MRDGVWGGGSCSQPWQSSALGGSNVLRSLRPYAADERKAGSGELSCNKSQRSTKKLIPGMMLVWCTCCRRCVCFAIMRDAESPRTLFELLFTHWEEPPECLQFDNGCNVQTYCLKREPEHFSRMRVLIDEAHYRGHTNCSKNYSTGKLTDQHFALSTIQTAVISLLH